LVFWIIVPLQSAIFNTGNLTRSIPTTVGTSHELVSFNEQKDRLNANFLNVAYGVSWLSQKLPSFTTMNYALLPFSPTSEPSIKSDTLTMSTEAKIYSTSLDCSPAKMRDSGPYTNFDNGRGCSVDLSFFGSGRYTLLYIGYYSDPHVDWFLANPNCTSEHSDNFLAIWASTDYLSDKGKNNNMTALFCQPKYHVEESLITANVSDGAIVSSRSRLSIQHRSFPSFRLPTNL
jgi:hypothetical protein